MGHKDALKKLTIPELIAILGRLEVTQHDLAQQEADVRAELAKRRAAITATQATSRTGRKRRR